MTTSVAIVSLFPLETLGGGELFTVESAQAICATGTTTTIAAPVDVPSARADLATRLRTPFIWTDAAGTEPPEVLAWSDVLSRLAAHDYVWVHQYLASDLVFDAIGSTASDQHLLFTSLGCEPVRALFADLYQPCPRQHFVEISAYAADRARGYARDATFVRAGIWRDDLVTLGDRAYLAREYMTLGRVLPHKGLETTIDALAAGDVLHVVGPSPDREYAAFLQRRAGGRRVIFHGSLPRPDVQRMLKTSSGLVSASTHVLFDGRRIEQPELLGLVLCEALRDGTLPVASDVPAFVEVMHALGLDDWTFAERSPHALRHRLDRLSALGDHERRVLLDEARQALVREFSWDDYWPRVLERIEDRAGGRIAEGLRCA
jgi:glycosyltransferase involved in cell wall biosynthesis